MKNTSMLGNGLERVLFLLLAGVASGLIMADSLDQLRPAVAEIQTAHGPLLQITMPENLLITCVLPKDTVPFPKPTCSLRIG
jgi:hypothetical protein